MLHLLFKTDLELYSLSDLRRASCWVVVDGFFISRYLTFFNAVILLQLYEEDRLLIEGWLDLAQRESFGGLSTQNRLRFAGSH